MTGWLLLSDRDTPVQADLPERLDQATLVIEMSWPVPTGVLLDWHRGTRALSLFFHPATGFGLFSREGEITRRFFLPGRIATEARHIRLRFRWDAPGQHWLMQADDAEGQPLGSASGRAPDGFASADLAALCAGHGVARRESSVLWYGVTSDALPPARIPWIGRATPVPTPGGDVAASLLRPGDWILTEDAGPQPLLSIQRHDMPGRGSHAPVILRAPFFARDRDLLVSADQRVVLGGPEAEYLFGEDQVLVAAGALADGTRAALDSRRAVTQGVSLSFGTGLHLIDVGGCLVMSAHHGPVTTAPIMPLRALHDYEALPLLSLLRRMRRSDAA